MFQGNGVFLDQGQNVIPDGTIAQKMLAGNFGPGAYQTAPPGFVMPEVRSQMAEALSAPAQDASQGQGVPFGPVSGDPISRMLTMQAQQQGYPTFAAAPNQAQMQNALAEALSNQYGP